MSLLASEDSNIYFSHMQLFDVHCSFLTELFKVWYFLEVTNHDGAYSALYGLHVAFVMFA